MHEGLMCRQIWEQFTNKLTRTQDSIIGLQKNKSKLLKEVNSSSWVQVGESAEVAEDENCVESFKRRVPIVSTINSLKFRPPEISGGK